MTGTPGVRYARKERYTEQRSANTGPRAHTPMDAGNTRKGRTVYRIVVASELSERYATTFEGMEMEAGGGRTVLTGEAKDQPHLHGILERVNALGLKLVSVESFPAPFPTETSRRQPSHS